jgi:hypothetical protein
MDTISMGCICYGPLGFAYQAILAVEHPWEMAADALHTASGSCRDVF